MIGQGRPHPARRRYALRGQQFARACFALVLLGLTVRADRTVEAAEPTIRVRIAFGGGKERLYLGHVTLTAGTLSDPQPLGIEADEPGSIYIEENSLELRSRSPRAYDGVDVTLSAPLTAKLKVEFAKEVGREGDNTTVEIGLADLLRDGHNTPLDDHGNRLLIRRAPGDALRLKLARDSLVFAPGEEWPLEIQPNLPHLNAGTNLHIKGTLSGARGGKTLWTKEQEVKLAAADQPLPSATLPITLPADEGVYELALEATERGLLRWNKPLAERKVQFVVLGPQPPAAAGSKIPWSVVMEFDPGSAKGWDLLGSWNALSGAKKGPLGSGQTATWQHALGTVVQLAPVPKNGEPTWEAYPLSISKIGAPHLVEIDLPSDVVQTLGVSVLEPNAAGAVVPTQLDTGIDVSEEASPGAPRWLRQRVLFWPRTKTPMLLLTNRRDAGRAAYGRIRVLAGPARLPKLLPEGGENAGRLWGSYFHKPLFTENFTASEALDAWSGRSLDDWQTFYEGGTRLIEYLQSVGQNGLLVTVAADGSTIYPSRALQPTPRYDSGMLFDQGHDPVRKDGLEMLLRLCDREGIRCVPALQFAAPLPELEALLRQGGAETAGLRWVAADGRTLLEHFEPQQGLAPYYNILDPRVQEAVLHVIQEVAQRCDQHSSFGGLALELGGDGYAVLPGDEWGFDDSTIARFERDCKLHVPGSGAQRYAERAQFLLGPKRQIWIDWRAAQLAAFYKRLHQEVANVRPDGKLYLCAVNLLTSPAVRRLTRPALPNRVKHDEALRQLGVQLELYRDTPGIVLPRPQRLAVGSPLAALAADVEFNRSLEMDRQFTAISAASLFYHEPQRNRLNAFDAKQPFGKGKSTTRQLLSIAPAEQANRRRFVHAVAALDSLEMFDGGWLLPLGQEASLRDVTSAYRKLPAQKFETLAEPSQPVAIRSLTMSGKTYIYLANDSAWETSVRLQVDMPSGCRLEDLSGNKKLATVSGTLWSVELGPYEMAAASFSAPQVKFSHPQVKIGGNVEGVLEQRIRDLSNRAAALSNPAALRVLANPSFDAAELNGKLPGWECNVPSAMKIDRQPGGGATGPALKLSGSGGLVTVRSEPFDPPASGRLSISVQLRVEQAQAQPNLRMALEGLQDGRPYYRAALVGAGPEAVRIGTDFSSYIFQVDDLPPSGLSQMRVRFDLLDEACVWIDDVQLYDLAFGDVERVELTKIITSANLALHAGKVGDCARVLEGYWPRYLTQHVPLVDTAAAAKDRQPEQTAEKPEPVDKKKKWWPF